MPLGLAVGLDKRHIVLVGVEVKQIWVYMPFSFLRATAYAVSAHMLSQFRPSVRLSVCLSVRHTGGSVKNG